MVKRRKRPSAPRTDGGPRGKRPDSNSRTQTGEPSRHGKGPRKPGRSGAIEPAGEQGRQSAPAAVQASSGASAGKRKAERGEWIYGVHAVTAALHNPARKPLRLIATRQAAADLSGNDAAKGGSIQAEVVQREEIDRVLPRGAVHQGLALQTDPLPPPDIEDLANEVASRDRAVVVVLDRVSDPRNVGAILRSAAALGACGVVVTERHAPEATGALAKAASGALETVPLVRVVNLARALDRLKQAGLWCLGLDSQGDTEIGDADLTGRIALVLGAEGAGLRRLTRDHCDLLVRLPMTDAVPSLNVSNAAAIALYAASRAGR